MSLIFIIHSLFAAHSTVTGIGNASKSIDIESATFYVTDSLIHLNKLGALSNTQRPNFCLQL